MQTFSGGTGLGGRGREGDRARSRQPHAEGDELRRSTFRARLAQSYRGQFYTPSLYYFVSLKGF